MTTIEAAPAWEARAGAKLSTFDQFCLDHYQEIRRGLSWTLGGQDLGTEAADEAFARACERWGRVSTMANPAGWVYRVGLNWGRRRQWRRGREIELLSRTMPRTHYEAQFADPDLAEAMAELPIKLRSVVTLRMILDYSEADTAATLGIAPGTVKSRLHRGLAALRERLALAEDRPATAGHDPGHAPGPGHQPSTGDRTGHHPGTAIDPEENAR